MKPAILFFREVGSTMDVAKQCLARGGGASSADAALLVLTADQEAQLHAALAHRQLFAVCAERQTRGRGTASRVWDSPTGNLFCTMVLPLESHAASSGTRVSPSLPLYLLPVLPLLIGLATREALLSSFPALAASSVTCKWPNDLLLSQKKAVGILIEGTEDAMLVGVGVNLAYAPPVQDGGRPSTCVADVIGDSATRAVTPAVMASVLVDRVEASLAQFSAVSIGTEDARRQAVVRAFDAIMDRQMTIFRRLPNGERSQEPLHPLGLTAFGLLRVRNAAGQEEVLVADYLY